MTTPNDRDGTDRSDAPYLPAARPVMTGPAPSPASPPTSPPSPTVPDAPSAPDAPYVPAPTPAAPAPSEPAPFDAKAMVESQKRINANPAYGALPTGTEASRDAAQKLRDQAQRKRRRNRLLGRAVAVLLLGGAAAAGWFGYQAYQDQQDRDAAERSAATDDEAGSVDAAVAALSPLGEQQEIVEALESLNDTAQASAGGLIGAVEDARELVGEMNDGDDTGADAAPVTADPFAARTVEFIHRRWETAASTSPMVEYFYSYDRVADTYTSDIRPDDRTVMVTGTNPEYRFSISPDGVVDRSPRSAASLDPAPDIALAEVFREDDVLPPAARPFATLVDSNVGTSIGDWFVYSVDTERWRDRDPGSFLLWVTTWNPRPANDPSLVEPDRREVSADVRDISTLREPATLRPFVPAVERTVPGAGVSFLVAADGRVAVAAIVDNTADFRMEYGLVGADNSATKLDFGDQNWAPAP